MSSLRQISEEFLELSSMILDNDTSEEMIQSIIDTLEAKNEEFSLKAENYAKILANIDDDIQATKKEEKRLSDRRKILECRYNWLKGNLMNNMKAIGKTDFTSGTYNFKIVKNGGKAPIELKVNVEELPDDLITITKKANNEAIRKYIESTGDITYATFGKRGESLRIK